MVKGQWEGEYTPRLFLKGSESRVCSLLVSAFAGFLLPVSRQINALVQLPPLYSGGTQGPWSATKQLSPKLV